MSILFNLTCLKEKILRAYIYIYIYSLGLKNNISDAILKIIYIYSGQTAEDF